jgi:hypothetical protein
VDGRINRWAVALVARRMGCRQSVHQRTRGEPPESRPPCYGAARVVRCAPPCHEAMPISDAQPSAGAALISGSLARSILVGFVHPVPPVLPFVRLIVPKNQQGRCVDGQRERLLLRQTPCHRDDRASRLSGRSRSARAVGSLGLGPKSEASATGWLTGSLGLASR